MVDFGNYLKEKRKEAGLTQKELAEKLGINNSTVNKWETGTAMSSQYIYNVARILRVNITDLVKAAAGEDLNSFTKALFVVNTGEYLNIDVKLPGDLLWKIDAHSYIIFSEEFNLHMDFRLLYKYQGEVHLFQYFLFGDSKLLKSLESGIPDIPMGDVKNIVGGECGTIHYLQPSL